MARSDNNSSFSSRISSSLSSSPVNGRERNDAASQAEASHVDVRPQPTLLMSSSSLPSNQKDSQVQHGPDCGRPSGRQRSCLFRPFLELSLTSSWLEGLGGCSLEFSSHPSVGRRILLFSFILLSPLLVFLSHSSVFVSSFKSMCVYGRGGA